MSILKKIFEILLHFVSRVLYFVTVIITLLICGIIFIVTYEPGKFKKQTTRKYKRIKFLTKVKVYIWKYFSWYVRFISTRLTVYLENNYNKYEYLIKE